MWCVGSALCRDDAGKRAKCAENSMQTRSLRLFSSLMFIGYRETLPRKKRRSE